MRKRLASYLGWLTSFLPGRRRLLREIDRRSRSLAAARMAAQEAKGRIASLQKKVQLLHTRLAKLEASRRTQKQESEQTRNTLHDSTRALKRAKRRRPSELVLEQTLEARLQPFKASKRDSAARQREKDWLSRSSSYRASSLAAGDAGVAGCTGPVTIRGLHWWIPAPTSEQPRNIAALMAGEGWLPLSDILETRELAVGTVMLDIGANIGTTSIPRIVLGDFQYIYAAEPEPANYACLVQSIVANGLGGFVLPDRVAVGSVDRDVSMAVASQIGEHRLLNPETGVEVGDSILQTVMVPCRRLDTWVSALNIDPGLVTFIKCDVQGWEPHVLSGAPELLKHKHIAWEIEVTPLLAQAAGWRLEDFYDLIRAHFTHFVDLKGTEGSRVRGTTELTAALAYLGKRAYYTNLLLYNAY